jgi:2-succinyl-6-hydroxy-2,4-cyclohexadiene-1-carboxylate synthase
LKLFCLPGFLGLSSDWTSVLGTGAEIQALDWFTPAVPGDLREALGAGLVKTGQWVNRFARQFNGPRVLMGYSLGGRIGLHALVNQPELWAGAVIISAHPGIEQSNEEEKAARFEADHRWSLRWRSDSWDEVIRDWNSQPVFQGFPALDRKAKDFAHWLGRAIFGPCFGRPFLRFFGSQGSMMGSFGVFWDP